MPYKDKDTGVEVLSTYDLMKLFAEEDNKTVAEEIESQFAEMEKARQEEISLIKDNRTYVWELLHSYIASENLYLETTGENPIPQITRVLETYDVDYTHDLLNFRRVFRAKVICEDGIERTIFVDHQYAGSVSYYDQPDELVEIMYE